MVQEILRAGQVKALAIVCCVSCQLVYRAGIYQVTYETSFLPDEITSSTGFDTAHAAPCE